MMLGEAWGSLLPVRFGENSKGRTRLNPPQRPGSSARTGVNSGAGLRERGGVIFRLLCFLFFLGFLFVIYLARHPLLRFAGEFWVVDEPAAQSDALIVLGDDNYAGDRAFRAAELYREGVAPVVVASGRMLRQSVSIADLMEHDLESFGVPAASIVKLPHRAENTREEALEAARLIHARGWKRVIVITSNYHARRARFIFGRVLPSSVTLRVSGARDSEFDPSRWWETRQGTKLFLSELEGYLVARWELRSEARPEVKGELRISFAERPLAPGHSNEHLDSVLLSRIGLETYGVCGVRAPFSGIL
jgi:uncharacterized SAM-binding protein YcdF (DUF218 family)